jgi:putative acyl-CoA dehydrogenase
MLPTHDVFNQAPPLRGYNACAQDVALVQALQREGGGWGMAEVQAYGAIAGDELLDLGFLANQTPPLFRPVDPYGHRIDEVVFHPAYHRTMQLAKAHDLHGMGWRGERAGAQVVRAALFYLHYQFEAGSLCPITMTHAAIPALRHQPSLAARWEPLILGKDYDPRALPAEQKSSLTIGMGMTEKQGGSDVRANTTRARPIGAGGPGEAYELTGHKWFFSAPMSDAFLVLAQSSGGLSCFLLPRWRPDGTRNAFAIQRLKDKLGDRSNASSEVEFHGAWAQMVGAEGRGVATILEMVAHTRLDCVLGSAALMRQAVAQAAHHASYRQVFGKRLLEQPLMQNVLADLAIESEAALVLAMRLARAFDASAADADEQAFARLATPVAKYWVCKRAPAQVGEALECLGGNGYVEEFLLARLYRQAPLNSIWEGSGNVQCLDVHRAMTRNPASIDAFLAELDAARGSDRRLDAHCSKLREALGKPSLVEGEARRLVEAMALALQGALLVRAGNAAVADGFCASRLDAGGLAFGTLPAGVACRDIIERARPKLADP